MLTDLPTRSSESKGRAAVESSDAPAPTRRLCVAAAPARAARPNPYNRLLTDALDAQGSIETEEFSWRRALDGDHDLLHFHWPEYFLRSRKAPWLSGARRASTLAMLKFAKRRGAKIVWTVHNLAPHGVSDTEPWPPYEQFAELVDGLIFLSHASLAAFSSRYPAAVAKQPTFVIPHGVYTGIYPQGMTRDAAREQLAFPCDATVACSLGALEPYKNLPTLLQAVVASQNDCLRCVVAGKPANSSIESSLRALASQDARIRLDAGFVADDALQIYFTSADFCVLPYAQVLNSGAAILALSFHTPVVVPAQGSLLELQATVGDAWVMTYGGDFDGGVLEQAIAWAGRDRPSAPDLTAMQWPCIAAKTYEAYAQIAK